MNQRVNQLRVMSIQMTRFVSLSSVRRHRVVARVKWNARPKCLEAISVFKRFLDVTHVLALGWIRLFHRPSSLVSWTARKLPRALDAAVCFWRRQLNRALDI